MIAMKKILLALAVFSTLVACKDKKELLLPNVSGIAGEVVVVLNANLHDKPIEDSIRQVLIEEYPMLPQQEPWFKPLIITEKGFTSVMQRHRNLILVKIGADYAKPKLTFQTDLWAKTQCLITASGPNSADLAAYITAHAATIRQVIEQAEINRNVQNYRKYEELNLRQQIEKSFGCSMSFPKGYQLRKATEGFVWISLETPKTSQGIFIYSYPYVGQKIDGYTLIKQRNAFLKRHVPGSLPNTHMITADVITPEIQKVQQNIKDGIQIIQMRGLWEVHNDYMGGPFVSHTVMDTLNFRVITMEAYVYAPKEDKRNLLRQATSVLRTFQLNTTDPFKATPKTSPKPTSKSTPNPTSKSTPKADASK